MTRNVGTRQATADLGERLGGEAIPAEAFFADPFERRPEFAKAYARLTASERSQHEEGSRGVSGTASSAFGILMQQLFGADSDRADRLDRNRRR